MDATHRAALRELNELNFARFDAKLEQRLAQSEMAEGRLARLTFLFWTALVAVAIALRTL